MITREQFELCVPALKEATPATYAKLIPYLTRHEQALLDELGLTAWPSDEGEAQAVRCASLRAAREAVSQLDLIVTPTGFGIVSNQNVAPASKERVAALRENLRRTASEAYDSLRFTLIRHDGWGTSARALITVDGPLWCPTLVRRYGIKPEGAEGTWQEEYELMRHRIEEATDHAADLISPELVNHLIDLMLTDGPDIDAARHPAEARIIERLRLYLAAHIMGQRWPRGAAETHRYRLLELVRQLRPEAYMNSRTRQAQQLSPYENRQHDPLYFFG